MDYGNPLSWVGLLVTAGFVSGVVTVAYLIVRRLSR